MLTKKDKVVKMKIIENDVYEIILKGSIFDEELAKEVLEEGGLDKYIRRRIYDHMELWHLHSICEYVSLIEVSWNHDEAANLIGIPYDLFMSVYDDWLENQWEDGENVGNALCECGCSPHPPKKRKKNIDNDVDSE